MWRKLFHNLADNRNEESFAFRMRRKRLARFLRLLGDFPAPVKVLDVGGTVEFWRDVPFPRECHVTILNLSGSTEGIPANFRCVAGDARNMPEFRTGEFDVCFSNSVIEHVGTLHDQIRMGREIQRVGRAYFVQTPYRYFPIEPHFFFPGWQFLPLVVRAGLLRRRGFGWMERIEDPLLARAEVEQVRLMTRRELGAIFSDGSIECERVGPFVKSIMAVRDGTGIDHAG